MARRDHRLELGDRIGRIGIAGDDAMRAQGLGRREDSVGMVELGDQYAAHARFSRSRRIALISLIATMGRKRRKRKMPVKKRPKLPSVVAQSQNVGQ